MGYVNISHSCGYTGDFDEFATAARNRFACPQCGEVWRLEKDRPAQRFESGLVIPATIKVVIEDQRQLPLARI